MIEAVAGLYVTVLALSIILPFRSRPHGWCGARMLR